MTRIAIVEDNKVIRESLAAYVHMDPEFRCICACGSAEEALAKLPGERPDVVLMDIQLPGLSGIECTARLKLVLPQTQILMFTIHAESELILQALRAGAIGYIFKSAAPEEILQAIREAKRGGSPMSGEAARKSSKPFTGSPPPPSASHSSLSASTR